MTRFLMVLALALAMAGCQREERRYRIDNVVRVFYAGSQSYRVVVEDPITREVKIIKCDTYVGDTMSLVADVPPDQPMWVDVKEGSYKRTVIHIHSGKDLEGGTIQGKNPTHLRSLP